MKRKNPYQRLLEEIQDFCWKLKYAHRTSMFYIPKDGLSDGWTMKDVYERTKAAEQLGYEVLIESTDEELSFIYRRKIDVPWHFKK